MLSYNEILTRLQNSANLIIASGNEVSINIISQYQSYFIVAFSDMNTIAKLYDFRNHINRFKLTTVYYFYPDTIKLLNNIKPSTVESKTLAYKRLLMVEKLHAIEDYKARYNIKSDKYTDILIDALTKEACTYYLKVSLFKESYDNYLFTDSKLVAYIFRDLTLYTDISNEITSIAKMSILHSTLSGSQYKIYYNILTDKLIAKDKSLINAFNAQQQHQINSFENKSSNAFENENQTIQRNQIQKPLVIEPQQTTSQQTTSQQTSPLKQLETDNKTNQNDINRYELSKHLQTSPLNDNQQNQTNQQQTKEIDINFNPVEEVESLKPLDSNDFDIDDMLFDEASTCLYPDFPNH